MMLSFLTPDLFDVLRYNFQPLLVLICACSPLSQAYLYPTHYLYLDKYIQFDISSKLWHLSLALTFTRTCTNIIWFLI
jgi:hypothetical protein